MNKYISRVVRFETLAILVIFLFPWIAHATHLFRNSASNLNSGTVPDARLSSSVGLLNTTATWSATQTFSSSTINNLTTTNSLIFPDGSSQNTAAGSSQWAASGADIKNSNTGNVGIGTASPAAKLDVRGSFISSGTTNLAAVSGNGNVGIGTLSAASSLLDIFGGSVTVRGSGAGLSVAGNTGIGTNAPSSLLDVFGGSLTIRGTNAGLAVTSGNVGIGTSSPASALQVVNGSITVTGTASEVRASTFSNVSALVFTDGSSVTAVATTSDMSAATSSQTVVTPARVKYNPGVAKFSVAFNASATIVGSYNVSSVTRASAGNFTINFTKPFANGNYTPVCSATFQGGVGYIVASINSINASNLVIETRGSGNTDIDPTETICVGFGDQ